MGNLLVMDNFAVDKISSKVEPRCYIDHTTPIDKVCHHCGQGMSSSVPSFDEPENGFERWLFNRLGRWQKVAFRNEEFKDLGLREILIREQGVHCYEPKCNHLDSSIAWITIFGSLFVITLFILMLLLWVPNYVDHIVFVRMIFIVPCALSFASALF